MLLLLLVAEEGHTSWDLGDHGDLASQLVLAYKCISTAFCWRQTLPYLVIRYDPVNDAEKEPLSFLASLHDWTLHWLPGGPALRQKIRAKNERKRLWLDSDTEEQIEEPCIKEMRTTDELQVSKRRTIRHHFCYSSYAQHGVSIAASVTIFCQYC